ncbi:hypothetical protein KW784_02095 [Candidatus Parcubacteria bacterium]|nr:hypothetical protein [Candidatus Parcubacteria bacterium]
MIFTWSAAAKVLIVLAIALVGGLLIWGLWRRASAISARAKGAYLVLAPKMNTVREILARASRKAGSYAYRRIRVRIRLFFRKRSAKKRAQKPSTPKVPGNWKGEWGMTIVRSTLLALITWWIFTKAVNSIPLPVEAGWLKIGLGLASIALVVWFAIWVIKSGWRPATATARRAPWGKIIAGVALIVLAVWVWSSWPKWTDPGIEIGTAWTAPIKIPLGTTAIWASRDNVAYEIRVWDKGTPTDYPFPRNPVPDKRDACERYNPIKQAGSSFQIRVVDPEIKRTVFDVSILPYKKGGPCEKTDAEKETPVAKGIPPPVPTLPLKPFDPFRLPGTVVKIDVIKMD